MARSSKKFVAAAVTGAIAGGAVALLFAPKPGRETRQQIRVKADSAVHTLKNRCKKNRDTVELEPVAAMDD